MNQQPIETARDADLRLSRQALLRAAQRAWDLAAQTGTAIVVSRNGIIEQIDPKAVAAGQAVHESMPPCGDKP